MLKIYRSHNEKIRCRGEPCGTFTAIKCTPGLKAIYGTDWVVRFESMKMATTYIAVRRGEWSNYGKVGIIDTGTRLKFCFFMESDECEVVRCELLETWYEDVQ